MDYLALAFGLALLVIGAGYFVEYAVSLAKHLRLHVTIFGAVIVAIGTSLPELVVTIESALKNAPDIIVGNILGSNIANVGLVLGVALLFGRSTFKQTPLEGKNKLLLVTSLIFLCLLQLKLLFWPVGLALLVLAGALIVGMSKDRGQKIQDVYLAKRDVIIGWIVLAASLAGVVVGSQVAVNSVLSIADANNISAGIIAATVIALGTSLPELVITLVAIKKRQHGLALGNILGSNLFNLVLIGGVGAVLTNLNTAVSLTGAMFFLVFTLLAFILAGNYFRPKRIHGAILIGLYILFIVLEYTV